MTATTLDHAIPNTVTRPQSNDSADQHLLPRSEPNTAMGASLLPRSAKTIKKAGRHLELLAKRLDTARRPRRRYFHLRGDVHGRTKANHSDCPLRVKAIFLYARWQQAHQHLQLIHGRVQVSQNHTVKAIDPIAPILAELPPPTSGNNHQCAVSSFHAVILPVVNRYVFLQRRR